MENTKTAEELKQFESSFNNAARLNKNTNDAARYLYENDITPLKKRISDIELAYKSVVSRTDDEIGFLKKRIEELETNQDAFFLHLVDVVACFTAEQNMYFATPVRRELIQKAKDTFNASTNSNPSTNEK